MITVKQISAKTWESFEPHPETQFSPDYDLGQFGHRYEFYRIYDLAFWDALVAYDPQEGKAVAVLSQVIGLEQATQILGEHRSASQTKRNNGKKAGGECI